MFITFPWGHPRVPHDCYLGTKSTKIIKLVSFKIARAKEITIASNTYQLSDIKLKG